MSSVHIALLRGINVGGKNKLPMQDLRAIFEEAGCSRVRTYIQSGNVLFEANAALTKTIPAKVAQAIRSQHGLSVPVVTRSARQVARVVAANPYAKPGADEKVLAVAFLADKPSRRQIASLDPDRSPGDQFTVLGSEIFLLIPNGAARTKLTNAWFDSRLKTTSTVRNWRTTQKLLELANT